MRFIIEIHPNGLNGFWKIDRYDGLFGVNVRGFHCRLRPIYFEIVFKVKQ